MAKNTYYFPHDYGARGDEDIVKLRAKMGWMGVGLYWAVIEKLHESGGRLSRDYENLAFDLQATVESIKNLVEDFKLFRLRDKTFENERVNRNLRAQKSKSDKAQISANLRWKMEQAKAMRTHSERNAKEKRGEESKEEEIKNIYNCFSFFENETFKDLYLDYLEMRRKKKKLPTEKAEELVLKKLHKYSLSEASTMLENSITNSWTDVYPIQEKNKPQILQMPKD